MLVCVLYDIGAVYEYQFGYKFAMEHGKRTFVASLFSNSQKG